MGKQFGKCIGNLISGANMLHVDGTVANLMTKMMPFYSNMFCVRLILSLLRCNFECSHIILVDNGLKLFSEDMNMPFASSKTFD